MMLAASIILLITLCGKEGAVGPIGNTGNQGTPVAVCPAGANGQPGSIIYSGTTAPATATGVNGEFYLNRSNGLLFGPKTNAGRGTGFSLKGPAGAISVTGTAGATVAAAANIILSGTGAPAANAGRPATITWTRADICWYSPNQVRDGSATFCNAQQEH